MAASMVRNSVTWLWEFEENHPDVDVRPFTAEHGFLAYISMPDGATRSVSHPNDLAAFMTELVAVVASRDARCAGRPRAVGAVRHR